MKKIVFEKRGETWRRHNRESIFQEKAWWGVLYERNELWLSENVIELYSQCSPVRCTRKLGKGYVNRFVLDFMYPIHLCNAFQCILQYAIWKVAVYWCPIFRTIGEFPSLLIKFSHCYQNVLIHNTKCEKGNNDNNFIFITADKFLLSF